MTYVDPIPATYNASSIAVDPVGLDGAAKAFAGHITDISNALTDIGNTLSGLNLSWAGDSADAMFRYGEELSGALEALFGTQLDPGAGVLNIASGALGSVARNYSLVDQSVQGMFSKFASGFDPLPKPTVSPVPGLPPLPVKPLDKPSDFVGGEWVEHTTAVDESGEVPVTDVFH
jgi:hypothetical protein